MSLANQSIRHLTVVICAISTFVTGCATASGNIATAYVSPLPYQGYDCQQISAEMVRVQGRASQLAGRLDQAASNDKALAGVGIVLFWPALFALGGTKEQEAEYARLKGENDAMQAVSVAKRCSLPPAATPTPTATTADAHPAIAVVN